MPRRTIVDPHFPGRLRQLRADRGLSLRGLSRLTYFGKSTLSELENGRKSPSAETAHQLDRALVAGGELAGMVTEAPDVTTPEDDARLSYVIARPTRLDVAAVRALGDVLATPRRLDDTLDAHVLLPWAEPQWLTVQQLARGPHTGELHAVAAEWTQFVGWLNAEARRDADAVRILIEAARQADALDNGTLAAQVENFRGYLERQRGNPRGIAPYASPILEYRPRQRNRQLDRPSSPGQFPGHHRRPASPAGPVLSPTTGSACR